MAQAKRRASKQKRKTSAPTTQAPPSNAAVEVAQRPSLQRASRPSLVAPAPTLPRSRQQTFCIATLCLIIAVGIACRFVGVLGWDEGAHLHPDERFLTMVVPDLKWPSSVGEYFGTQGAPLSPFTPLYPDGKPKNPLFVYGQLPLNLVKAVAVALSVLQPHWPAPARLLLGDSYDGALYVGRFLSALFDAGSVLLIGLIGRRLGGNRLGLLAAALTSLIALHIQQSHFFTVDTFATFFTLASFIAAIGKPDTGLLETDANAPPKRGRRDLLPALWAGLWWGTALSCKISAILFLPVIVPLIIAHWRDASLKATLRNGLRPAMLLLVVTFVTFRVLNPIAFEGHPTPLTLSGLLDIRLPVQADAIAEVKPLQKLQDMGLVVAEPGPQFLSALRQQQQISDGQTDLVWNLQWFGRRNYLWPLRNLMLWGVGWPLMLASIMGMGLIFIVPTRRPLPIGLYAAASWTLLVFLYYGRWYSKFSRYYLLATPFLALCAAYALLLLWQFAARQNGTKQRPWQLAAWGVSAGVCGLTTLWACAVTSIYTRPHTRMEASRWIRQNIAPGTPIANETSWDDSLPVSDTGGLKMLNLELYDTDDAQKRQKLLDLLDQTQWLFISSNRVWGTVPRLSHRWPMTTAYYRALFSGQLGFKLTQEFTSYPQLNLPGLHLQFPDVNIEEALTVYDHPRVALFQKTPAWSRAVAERILDPALLAQTDTTPLPELLQQPWRPDENSLPWLPELAAAKE